MTAAGAGEGHRLRAVLWNASGRFVFRCTPHNCNALRRVILRVFGARLAPRTKLRRSVRIDRPWNLEMGELSIIGDDAALRARTSIRIGARAVISQLSILSTEVRESDAPGHPTRSAPITIGDDCWIAADTLVLPGATVHCGTVVGARGMVVGTLPAWKVATGEPAIPRGERVMRPAAGNISAGAGAGASSGARTGTRAA